MFCSGSILQTFMISVGISDTTISVYNAVIQLAQAISIIVMLFVADKIKNTIRTFSFVVFSISLIAISLFVCIFLRSDVLAVKLVIFISSIFAYLMIGVKYSLDYRVLYEVFEVGNTGKILGISVAISGLVAFGFSAIYSFMVSKLDYYDVMICFFAFALCSFTSAT